MSRTQKSNGRQRKNKQRDRKRKKKALGGMPILRGWDRGFGWRCRGASGTDTVLDAIGDGGPAVGVVWQVDKSTKTVADTLERTARKVGANARRVGRIERWVVGSVATLSDGGLPDGGVPESPADPTPRTKGGSPYWGLGVWERDRLYRFTRSREDARCMCAVCVCGRELGSVRPIR